MAEIDRVYGAIRAFFNASGADQVALLAKPIESCIERASRRSAEMRTTNEEILNLTKTAESSLKKLLEALPTDRETLIQRFSEVAEQAMVARRANYPIENPDAPWALPTPREALLNDEDAYAFAIFDTLADEISELLPSLYRLAVEGSWEDSVASKTQ